MIPYLGYVERHWHEGYQVGTLLWQELQAQGIPGRLSSVPWALKREGPMDGRRRIAMPPARPQRKALSLHQGMWLLLQVVHDLLARDCTAQTALITARPAFATAMELAQPFQQLL